MSFTPLQETTTMSSKRNLAARVGGWSARHWKTAVFGWLAFVIVAFHFGGSVATDTLKQSELGVGESGHADKTYEKSYKQEQGEMVLLTSKHLKNNDPRFRAAAADLSKRLKTVPGVTEIVNPYTTESKGLLSKVRNAAMLPYSIPGEIDDKKVEDTSGAEAAAVRAVAKDHPNLRIETFGGATTEKAFNKIFEDDMSKATPAWALRRRRAKRPATCPGRSGSRCWPSAR
jgi:uncharacterized membrane protein YdfJ with MMPL/SSD domain